MFNTLLFLSNYALVLVYGIVIASVTAGITLSKRNICSLSALGLIISSIQAILYVLLSYQWVEKLYPLITHLPMVVFFIYYYKKSVLTSLSAVLVAYLFTTPRRLIGTCVFVIFNNNHNAFYISQILITPIFLYLICRYISTPLKKLISVKDKSLYLFSTFLMIYYIFSYLTTVYSNLLYSGDLVAVELLSTICVLSYVVLTVLYYQETIKRMDTEQNYRLLHIKSQQAETSLNSMKEINKLTAQYRHDLRHHMHYLKTCLANKKIDDATKYIDKLCKSFDSVKIETFCENTDANLVLSYYISLARTAKINTNVATVIPKDISLSPLDISIILSNLLENALKACSKMQNSRERKLAVFSTVKDGKFYLSVSNSYEGDVTIIDGIPQTNISGHGIGVNSIASIVKNHNGTFVYEAENGIFTFKMIV